MITLAKKNRFENYTVRIITRMDILPYIFDIHYAQRMPSVSYAFGLFESGYLVGICTFGVPASNPLCRGVCGEEYQKQVYELNRLALKNNKPNEASYLVGNALKQLGEHEDFIIVSYADSGQEHIGVVYQATNFLFTGTSKARTDMDAGDGKHSRHHNGDPSKRVQRTPKHRYITFIGNKAWRKKARKALKYKIQPYPKK